MVISLIGIIGIFTCLLGCWLPNLYGSRSSFGEGKQIWYGHEAELECLFCFIHLFIDLFSVGVMMFECFTGYLPYLNRPLLYIPYL